MVGAASAGADLGKVPAEEFGQIRLLASVGDVGIEYPHSSRRAPLLHRYDRGRGQRNFR